MSKIRIMIAALAIAALAGCKTKQHAIRETTYTDTTRITLDSSSVTNENTSTETTEVARADSTFVRFVEGGGVVEIDSAGTMHFWGVAAIKHGRHSHAQKQQQRAASTTVTTLRKDEKKAVQQVQREEARPLPKQRRTLLDKMLISIGRLACVAVLVFLIYIYIKRKIR
ncbi:MAG: hypothetical protein HXK18_03965 [Alloprevotella tannerae]|nr:hypothetical protein [Alloprevotella tannerae]